MFFRLILENANGDRVDMTTTANQYMLWDIEYYKCGSFEVYIAANPQNIEIFQTGKIVGRDDD